MAENFDPNIIQSNANVLPQYTPQGGALSAPAGALTPEDAAMRDLLRKTYIDSQTASAGALTTGDAASRQYVDGQNEKRRVLQASYDKLLSQKPNNSEMLFALGAGLLSPTKTGGLSGFGESIGNAARAIGPAAGRANELRRANEKLGIEYQLGMSGVDTDIANSNTERARHRGTVAAAQGAGALTALGQMDARQQAAALARERMAMQDALAAEARALTQARLDLLARAQDDREKSKLEKPVPAAIIKMEREDLEAIGTVETINDTLSGFLSQIETGELNLGTFNNLISGAQNWAAMSDDESANYNNFQAGLEKLRNDSLRLNNGVQTDADAQRAWKELIENINDPKIVTLRLKTIHRLNMRAAALKQENLDRLHEQYPGLVPKATKAKKPAPLDRTVVPTVTPTIFDPNDMDPLKLFEGRKWPSPPEGN